MLTDEVKYMVHSTKPTRAPDMIVVILRPLHRVRPERILRMPLDCYDWRRAA